MNRDPLAVGSRLIGIYWGMRLGMAAIWLWTAFVSWYAFPHAESIEWLRRIGISANAESALAALCLLDLVMGILTLTFASALLWWFQFFVVLAYSIVIGILLPEFLLQPFGPIVKNIAVLGCLAYLGMAERSRRAVCTG